MKKMLYIGALFAMVLALSNAAGAQETNFSDRLTANELQSFYFYPQTNVYYSFEKGQYIFPRSDKWMTATRLPEKMKLNRKQRLLIEHAGGEVWKENYDHLRQYWKTTHDKPVIAFLKAGKIGDKFL